MNFRPELVEKILAGEKTQTRRIMSDKPRSPWYGGGCALQAGRDYAVCPGRGKNQVARIRVTEVRSQLAGAIDDAGARAEGFADRTEFVAYWERLHKTFDPTTPVWVVSFELISVTP